MKRFIASAMIGLLMTTSVAYAQHRHDHRWNHRHHHHHQLRYDHGRWIVPALIGGTVVYAATRPSTVVIQDPVVVAQPTPLVITPPSPVVAQTPQASLQSPPLGYRWEEILDARCNCNRWVLVPN